MHLTSASSTAAQARQANRAALLIVFVVVFLDLLGFGLVLPLLPRFADDKVLGHLIPGGRHSPLGGPILGALLASFSLMQFLFSPWWGRLSDRLGRRPILLMGLASSVVFYLLLGIALDVSQGQPALGLALLFLARIGAGVAGATVGTAQAVIADSTPPEQRKHGMALVGAAFGIGFTFGPLVGFAALSWWQEVPGAVGYVAAALSLVALLLGLGLLPETRAAEASSAPRQLWPWDGWGQVLRLPQVGILVLIFGLANFCFSSLESTLALYNKDLLQVEDRHNLLIFAYVGFVQLMTQGVLYRRLAHRWSEATFIWFGLSLTCVGLASLAGAALLHHFQAFAGGPLLAWVMVTLALAVVGFACVTPSLQALISRRSDPERQGAVLGVNHSASALARILGPLAGLSLYKLESSHLLPYAFGAGLLLLLLPLFRAGMRE